MWHRHVLCHSSLRLSRKLQPFSCPEINELIGRRIDVTSSFDVDIEQKPRELRWFQGKVLSMIGGTREPIVEVEWDSIPDALGYENTTVSNLRLLPSKWRKDEERACIMDVEIDVESDIDPESDQETDPVDDEIETEVE